MPQQNRTPRTTEEELAHREQSLMNRQDFRTIHTMKDTPRLSELHEYRMSKIRENLEAERKKSWIYVGNSFRQPPPAK
uniref:Uncharacterized protein n=1 Tax=Caenorhabditis japonica TaxID=281687 RepID=A0A8R1EJX3_CAEJA